jgi:hypothetical protein
MGAVVDVEEEEDGPASGVALRHDLSAAVECVCGASHSDLAALAKRGWQALGGDAALMVICTCGAAITADIARDACLCDTCRRLVTGSDDDIKVCVVHGGAKPGAVRRVLPARHDARRLARMARRWFYLPAGCDMQTDGRVTQPCCLDG